MPTAEVDVPEGSNPPRLAANTRANGHAPASRREPRGVGPGVESCRHIPPLRAGNAARGVSAIARTATVENAPVPAVAPLRASSRGGALLPTSSHREVRNTRNVRLRSCRPTTQTDQATTAPTRAALMRPHHLIAYAAIVLLIMIALLQLTDWLTR